MEMSEDEIWVGVGCCVGAAALYLLRTALLMDVESLVKVTRIAQARDLSLLLDTASMVLPLIVSISGKVGSDSPIKCESSGLQCVIVKETREKRILKHGTITVVNSRDNSEEVRSWKEEQYDIQSVNKGVPWYLDDGTSQVFVLGAEHASHWDRVVGHGRDYRSRSTPVALDNSQGDMDLVVKTSKPVLLTGTPLNVIGEAVKDDTGKIRIQQPEKGPFYVSGRNIDEIIDNCKGGAWFCTYASLVLALPGIYLIGKLTFQYIMGRYCNQEPHRVLDAATETPGSDDEVSLPDASDGLGVTELIPDLCVICLEQVYNSVLVPCGHMCCCVDCSSNLTECPLCRQRINQVVRVFRS